MLINLILMFTHLESSDVQKACDIFLCFNINNEAFTYFLFAVVQVMIYHLNCDSFLCKYVCLYATYMVYGGVRRMWFHFDSREQKNMILYQF
jgi:hypothetical protein